MKTHAVHKFLSFLLATAFAVSLLPILTYQTSAAGVQEFNNFQPLISDYIEARETTIKSGDTELLQNIAVHGIVEDELAHRDAMQSKNVVFESSSYEIIHIEESSTIIQIDITETYYCVVNNNENTQNIEHTLIVMYDEIGEPKIVSDSYTDTLVSFDSCSYVSPEDMILPYASVANYGGCLVSIAKSQLGYLEKATNANLDSFTANAGSGDYTKYGAWYGINPGAWCAMFVSWCANQAQISTSVIPKYAGCTTGMGLFKNMQRFHYSTTYGGTYSPQVGDIFFTGPSKTTSGHTGIVTSVSANTITVVDGNWSNKVSTHTYRLTDSSLIGFAHPNYGSISHKWVKKPTYYECVICGERATSIPDIQ